MDFWSMLFDTINSQIGKTQDYYNQYLEDNKWRENVSDQTLLQLYDEIAGHLDRTPNANGIGFNADYLKDFQEAILSNDYRSVQGLLASGQYDKISPSMEKYLDNQIANQSVLESRAWEQEMANTDLTRAAKQLEQLGLSSSGVLQTGGSGVNAAGVAANSKTNVALERYQQKMAMARQLLGMTSQMASAGIYGGAIGLARKASSVMTSEACNSAYRTLSYEGRPQSFKDYKRIIDERQEILRQLREDD